MTEITKPADLSVVWASAGDILNPGNTKYQTGWQVEIPPRQWENFIQNKQDQAIAHINQHGIAVWDSITEYQAAKSYAQGVTTGAVYRCKVTNTAQDPETDITNAYWELAFASPGDFYTKTAADAAFLGAADNLADLSNTATARTNLSVYSKTEVDNKTTVASTAQAQALASNSTLLTPLRLLEAFQGANQQNGVNGFQKLPGGWIIQRGNVTQNSQTTQTYTFPTAFPTACRAILACKGSDLVLTGEYSVGIQAVSASQFRITNTSSTVNPQSIYWLAIGE